MPLKQPASSGKLILHLCGRDVLRPLRDQILRLSGFQVDSTSSMEEAMVLFRAKPYELVLIDVAGDDQLPDAEKACSAVKTACPAQLVAFVCNWRVAVLTDCPDEILRTEFDPQRFVEGVRVLLH